MHKYPGGVIGMQEEKTHMSTSDSNKKIAAVIEHMMKTGHTKNDEIKRVEILEYILEDMNKEELTEVSDFLIEHLDRETHIEAIKTLLGKVDLDKADEYDIGKYEYEIGITEDTTKAEKKLIAKELLRMFAVNIVNNNSFHGKQQTDGNYKIIRRPITRKLVEKHLSGKITLGLYAGKGHFFKLPCGIDQTTGKRHKFLSPEPSTLLDFLRAANAKPQQVIFEA